MLRVVFLAVSTVALLGACTKGEDKRVLFGGMYFPSKAKKAEDDRSVFNVVVNRAGQSLDNARLAGEYEATRYCIKNYGSSRVAWISGPEQPDAVLLSAKDSLIMQGECKI